MTVWEPERGLADQRISSRDEATAARACFTMDDQAVTVLFDLVTNPGQLELQCHLWGCTADTYATCRIRGGMRVPSTARAAGG
jgi:hypothetical protein